MTIFFGEPGKVAVGFADGGGWTGLWPASCDGSICKLADLKPGFKVRVTTKKDDKDVVTRIRALNKNEKVD